MNKIDTFILIGGRSSRMGRDKAFLELNGQALSERALQTVRKSFPESNVRFVAANAAQFGIEAIRAGAPFVFDQVEGRGPVGGLYTALAHAMTSWIFVLACDYPFVSAKLLKLLEEYISEDHGAVIPEQEDGRLQPLCAFYRVAMARSVIEQIIERPRVAPPLHKIVDELQPRILKNREFQHLPGSDCFFLNVNTAANLSEARRLEIDCLTNKKFDI